MAVPLIYNLRSVKARWTSAIVAVLGIAGTVGVFIAMLSLARGFKATLVSSGSPGNAIVLRAGATSEMAGVVTLDSVKVLQGAPGVLRTANGPLVTPEVVVVAPFPLRSTGTDANVQVRGVSPNVLEIRKNVRIAQGRFFQPGLSELVVGRNAVQSYMGLMLGSIVKFGGDDWRVVGVFDAGGSAFDSEVWCDARVLNQVYKRPENLFQSVTVHLTSPAALQEFKDAVTSDPRMNVDVTREVDYYDKQSQSLTRLITILGGLVAGIMGVGAIFGALNTMYSAVAERSREIATMRALGFGASSMVVVICLRSAVDLAGRGARLRGGASLKRADHRGDELADVFASGLRIPHHAVIACGGIVFALAMGLLGGVPPAIRAANTPVATALREL